MCLRTSFNSFSPSTRESKPDCSTFSQSCETLFIMSRPFSFGLHLGKCDSRPDHHRRKNDQREHPLDEIPVLMRRSRGELAQQSRRQSDKSVAPTQATEQPDTHRMRDEPTSNAEKKPLRNWRHHTLTIAYRELQVLPKISCLDTHHRVGHCEEHILITLEQKRQEQSKAHKHTPITPHIDENNFIRQQKTPTRWTP